MLELAKQAVDTATASGASYADARVIQKESQVIQTKGMNVSGLNIGNSKVWDSTHKRNDHQ